MSSRDEIQVAVQTHAAWVGRLRTAIEESGTSATGSEFALLKVGADDQCSFGRWLYGDSIPERLRMTSRYSEIRRVHAAFHAAASDALGLASAGLQTDAHEAVKLFADLSDDLIQVLEAWQAEMS